MTHIQINFDYLELELERKKMTKNFPNKNITFFPLKRIKIMRLFEFAKLFSDL